MARSTEIVSTRCQILTACSYHNCTGDSTLGCSSISSASTFHFVAGKTHRLRLINAGAEALQRFSIDNHTLTVIANDFVPIVPYETHVVTLGVGQRCDVLVRATGSGADAVWMRSDISTLCAATNQPHALAAVHYPEAKDSTVPSTIGYLINDTNCTNVLYLL